MYKAKVYVTLKPTVNDPQGLTVQGGLNLLGFTTVKGVRVGKYLEIQMEAEDAEAAREKVDGMCHQLLANPIIEDYSFDLEELSPTQ